MHPAAVDVVLGAELTVELDEPAIAHSGMLQDIRYGTPTLARLFVPRLRA